VHHLYNEYENIFNIDFKMCFGNIESLKKYDKDISYHTVQDLIFFCET
jgi:hypothetical protein